MFIVIVMYENNDITFFDVLPVDCHIVVPLRYTLLVIKSQRMQELMYNYSVIYASKSAGPQVYLLAEPELGDSLRMGEGGTFPPLRPT